MGAAYLVYVGVSMLRSNASSFDVPSDGAASSSRWSLYVKSLLVGASNPKALLFFTAFLPQFLIPAAPRLPQFVVLGLTFVCFEMFWLMFYATFAASIAPWLRVKGRARTFNRASGVIFIGAGALPASVERAGGA